MIGLPQHGRSTNGVGNVPAAVGAADAFVSLYSQYHEEQYSSSSYTGDPFDQIATVTFTGPSAQTIETQVFYLGSDQWAWRFTGTEVGQWSWSVASTDLPDLDGDSGTIEVTANASAYGFLTQTSGNKWARQVGDGSLEVFVPHFRLTFIESTALQGYSQSYIDGLLDTRMTDEGFNGVFEFMGSAWCDASVTSRNWNATVSRAPDPDSFDALERVIREVYNRGGVTHIWYIGDCASNQCPEYAFGSAGAATTEEQRLLRYIAARLGPLPGWMMGYGWDLNEFATEAEIDGWGSYLRARLGWDHILTARDQTNDTNPYSIWGNADTRSKGGFFGGPSYADLTTVLDQDANKALSFDERFYKSRLGTEQAIRRSLWTHNMAGGVSAIWGWDGAFEVGAFPTPSWFKTFFSFWDGRFKSDFVRDNALSSSGAWVLRSADHDQQIYYDEGVSSIDIDTSSASGSLQVIAVDASGAYVEINEGSVSPGTHTINLGSTSDWALAVGNI